MADFQRIKGFKKPSLSVSKSAKNIIWNKFKESKVSKEIDSVSFVKFSNDLKRELFAGSASRLNVYSRLDMEKLRSFSKSAEVVRCVGFRSDGKLFAIGNSAGNIQIFDTASKKLIRTLIGHESSVRKVSFLPNKTHLVSVSDDRTFRIWDIPSEQELKKISAHEDYVRAMCLSENGQFLVTGSYDHSIKVWDLQNDGESLCLNHGAPVEAVLLSPNSSMIVSCGSNYVKFWDIASGSLLHTMFPHQKTITCMTYNADGSFLLTGSLDRHSKVIDLVNFGVVHGYKFPSPIMTLDCDNVDSSLAFGLANGSTVLKTRKIPSTESQQVMNFAVFDSLVKKSKSRYTKLDRLFKSFKFRDALFTCLKDGNVNLIIACITELLAYDALPTALTGLDGENLDLLLKFISRNIIKCEFSSLLIEVSWLILDIYAEEIGNKPELLEYLSDVRNKLSLESKVKTMALEISGQLEMLSCS